MNACMCEGIGKLPVLRTYAEMSIMLHAFGCLVVRRFSLERKFMLSSPSQLQLSHIFISNQYNVFRWIHAGLKIYGGSAMDGKVSAYQIRFAFLTCIALHCITLHCTLLYCVLLH